MTHGRFPEDRRLPPEVVPGSTLIRKDPRSRSHRARQRTLSRESALVKSQSFEQRRPRAYTQDYDPASLEDEGGRGRHPLLDEDQEHLLEALLAVSPQDLGSPHVS